MGALTYRGVAESQHRALDGGGASVIGISDTSLPDFKLARRYFTLAPIIAAMPFAGDSRRRSVVLLGAGVAAVFRMLGGLQAFNTSNIRFLNPETAGRDAGLYGPHCGRLSAADGAAAASVAGTSSSYMPDQSSSALGSRLRTRMVLGAALIALTPAVFMFLFSFQLMNRSIDRWFSPNTSELREDSTRVVLELAQYVTSNARGEAESIAASGAADLSLPSLAECAWLASHHAARAALRWSTTKTGK